MKKISIIIPYFDRHRYIEDCLISIARQSYRLLEVIIINDSSSPTSTAYLQTIIANMKDQFEIIYLEQPSNLGAGAARNRGVEVATGEYLNFLDSDDLI